MEADENVIGSFRKMIWSRDIRATEAFSCFLTFLMPSASLRYGKSACLCLKEKRFISCFLFFLMEKWKLKNLNTAESDLFNFLYIIYNINIWNKAALDPNSRTLFRPSVWSGSGSRINRLIIYNLRFLYDWFVKEDEYFLLILHVGSLWSF